MSADDPTATTAASIPFPRVVSCAFIPPHLCPPLLPPSLPSLLPLARMESTEGWAPSGPSLPPAFLSPSPSEASLSPPPPSLLPSVTSLTFTSPALSLPDFPVMSSLPPEPPIPVPPSPPLHLTSPSLLHRLSISGQISAFGLASRLGEAFSTPTSRKGSLSQGSAHYTPRTRGSQSFAVEQSVRGGPSQDVGLHLTTPRLTTPRVLPPLTSPSNRMRTATAGLAVLPYRSPSPSHSRSARTEGSSPEMGIGQASSRQVHPLDAIRAGMQPLSAYPTTAPQGGGGAALSPSSSPQSALRESIQEERYRGNSSSELPPTVGGTALPSSSPPPPIEPPHAAVEGGGGAEAIPPLVEAPPPKACAAFIGGLISSLIFSVVYLPFTVAILTQSAVQRRPILPKDWQTELQGPYWLFAFSLFLFLFVWPFVLVFGLLTHSGMWSIFNNDVDDAIPFTLCLSLYLTLFVCLHLITFYYAHLRVDLRQIHSDVRQLHFNRSTLLCTAAILFEAVQLISPWLSTSSLGLRTLTGSSATYQTQLSNSAVLFDLGGWQVRDINTYLETFWIAFAVIIFYAFALGYGIHSNMQPSHWASGILFELIPGTFYLSIVGRMLSVLNCSPDGEGAYKLGGDDGIECWDTVFHRSMCMASLMGLLFYSSSAMFVACYRGDGSGNPKAVKFKPVYLVLERTLRDLFAMTTGLISEQKLSRALSFPILVVLLSSTAYMQPCSVPSLTRLKLLSQGSAVWLLTWTFVADLFRPVTSWFDEFVPVLVIYGWIGGAVLYLAYEVLCYHRRYGRRERRQSMVGITMEDLKAFAKEDDESEGPALPSIEMAKGPPVFSVSVGAAGPAAVGVTEVAAHPVNVPIAIHIDHSSSPSSTWVTRDIRDGGMTQVERPQRPALALQMLRVLDIQEQALKHTEAALCERTQATLVPGGVPRTSISIQDSTEQHRETSQYP